jgi:hypothetical protein
VGNIEGEKCFDLYSPGIVRGHDGSDIQNFIAENFFSISQFQEQDRIMSIILTGSEFNWSQIDCCIHRERITMWLAYQ